MRPRVRGEINVTPLVDVALVVLIIFMVVGPLIRNGPDVFLPQTAHPEKLAETPPRLALTLRADGTVFLDELPLPRPALDGALAGRRLDGIQVVVRADGRLPYGEVREVLALLAARAVKHAALETRRAAAPGAVREF